MWPLYAVDRELSAYNMSWQEYVDSTLISTGTVSAAAIVGLDGNVWSASAGFTVTEKEALKLIAGFDDQTCLFGGVFAGGVYYLFLRASDDTIHGKRGEKGIVICKTAKTIIIGTYRDGMAAGNCSVTVSKLMDYLKNAGY